MHHVKTRIEAETAWVTLYRPERLNAMDRQLMSDLTQALEAVAEHDDVRVVVLSGAGRVFSVGGDLAAGAGGGVVSDDEDESVRRMRDFMRASELLFSMDKITIAQLHGACAGAAFALACACDLRIASESTVFMTAFLTAGLPGDYGGTWLLPRIVGAGRARSMFLLPERLDANQALDWGLVHSVTHDDEGLESEVRATVSRLNASAPRALALMKRNLNDALRLPFGDLLDLEASRQIECAGTQDAEEAARAFVEKREPRFTGR